MRKLNISKINPTAINIKGINAKPLEIFTIIKLLIFLFDKIQRKDLYRIINL